MVRAFKYQIQEDEQFNHICSQNKYSHKMCSYCKADLCLCFHISIKQIFSSCILLYTSVFLKFVFMKQYAPNRCGPSIEVSVRMGGRGPGAYDQRIKVIAKMQKKVGWVGEGGGGGSEWI